MIWTHTSGCAHPTQMMWEPRERFSFIISFFMCVCVCCSPSSFSSCSIGGLSEFGRKPRKPQMKCRRKNERTHTQTHPISVLTFHSVFLGRNAHDTPFYLTCVCVYSCICWYFPCVCDCIRTQKSGTLTFNLIPHQPLPVYPSSDPGTVCTSDGMKCNTVMFLSVFWTLCGCLTLRVLM